ncbi:MAG TPA: thioredoxin domain-containing protein [Anaeromyxobacteraceae bacterium]|jgi:protein-disulfide isomerase
MRILAPTLAAALLALGIAAPLAGPPRAAADAADLLPGVDLEALSAAQRQVLAAVAAEEFCYCGCPHTLSQCLHTHAQCKHAPRMARLAARLAASGLQGGEILRLLSEYYGSFERPRRAALDLAAFGPPLGEAAAPVALVAFTDFTCPHCQALRPVVEGFVRAHAARVRLFQKPYPIAGHPRAQEAALAAEWARDAGLYWKMSDLLFGNPVALSDGDLADRARKLGGDPVALRAALESSALRARVAASQAEGRAAGIRGTPSFFLNGRRLVIPDVTAAGLEFTLEDEEEWAKRGGWAKD